MTSANIGFTLSPSRSELPCLRQCQVTFAQPLAYFRIVTGMDPGMIESGAEDLANAIDAFMKAIAKHRHFERETDPPAV